MRKYPVFLSLTVLAIWAVLPAIASQQEVSFITEMTSPQFKEPTDVAVDSDGTAYVTDAGADLVIAIGIEGQVVKAAWGGVEKGRPWALKKPTAIAVHNDKLYVTDADSDSVLIFTKAGRFVSSFGKGGSGLKQFSDPSGITVARNLVYVADSGNDRIQVLSLDGIYQDTFGDDKTLRDLKDVGVDAEGNVYAVDGNDVVIFSPDGKVKTRYMAVENAAGIYMDADGFYVAGKTSVKKFNYKGRPELSFGTGGKGRAQFGEIAGVFVDYFGKIYLADSGKKSVQVFSAPKGKPELEETPYDTSYRSAGEIKAYATRVEWNGKDKIYAIEDKERKIIVIGETVEKSFPRDRKNGWDDPKGLAVDTDGTIWVADAGRDQVLKVGPNGNLIFPIGASGSKPGYFSDPSDIAVSPKGILFIADTGNDRIQTFTREGVFLSEFGKAPTGDRVLDDPIALGLGPDNTVYVLDRNKVTMFNDNGKILGSFGTRGSGKGQFDAPSDLIVTSSELYVLDTGNGRVQVFDLKGKFLRLFGSKGEGRGEFREPVSFAMMDSTRLVIADKSRSDIQKIDIIYTPAMPRGLTAMSGMHAVELKWAGSPESFVERYNIFRKGGKGDFKLIGSSPTNVFNDAGLEPDMEFTYRITAVAKGGNESGPSLEAVSVARKYIPSDAPWSSIAPGERDVTITWTAAPEEFVSSYRIYRKEEGQFVLMDEVTGTEYHDVKVKPDTDYEYKLATVSSDKAESQGVALKGRTLKQTKASVEFVADKMERVFANNYKAYERTPFGHIKIVNNTWEKIPALTVSVMVKNFMDFPTEKTIEGIEPGGTVVAPLTAVFNAAVLELTENTTIQAEITVSYYDEKELRAFKRSEPIAFYEKHHMTWDDREKVATFITPKDSTIMTFARDIARQYSDSPDPIIYARAVFDAFAVMGLSYMPDPNNPYQVTSENSSIVDYVQYPSETLKRKTGDCDDLAGLYASALESLGVRTALVDAPGHLFMMFSTDMTEEQVMADSYSNMFVFYDGYVWVPVEITLVGSSFMDAWSRGVDSYDRFKDKGLEVIELRKAWLKYKPASLPDNAWRAEEVQRATIEKRFGEELGQIRGLKIRSLSKKYLDALQKNPNDADANLQLGIIYGENQSLQLAEEFFKKVVSLEPNNASAINNLGNVYYMTAKYSDSAAYYEKAAAIDTKDGFVLANLSRAYIKLGRMREARDAFDRATAKNPEIARIYQSVALKLADPSIMLLDSPKKNN